MTQLNAQDDYIKTALRLPRALHGDVQQAAAASGRSMNAEIIQRLTDSFVAERNQTDMIVTFTCGSTIRVEDLHHMVDLVRAGLEGLPAQVAIRIVLGSELPTTVTVVKGVGY